MFDVISFLTNSYYSLIAVLTPFFDAVYLLQIGFGLLFIWSAYRFLISPWFGGIGSLSSDRARRDFRSDSKKR